MEQISFTSTYRIPLIGPTGKKQALKTIASKYQNVLYPSGNQGNVRVSIRKRLDEGFEQKIKQKGFKIFQKFAKHNVPKTNNRMDNYIKESLKSGDYKQFGKQKG